MRLHEIAVEAPVCVGNRRTKQSQVLGRQAMQAPSAAPTRRLRRKTNVEHATNASTWASISISLGPLFLRGTVRLRRRVIVDLSLRSSPAILEGAMLSLIFQSLASRSSSGDRELPGMVRASELH